MKHQDPTRSLEDLVREMRRLVLDSQEYMAQKRHSHSDKSWHERRERRIVEIKEELAKMLKGMRG